MWLLNRGDHIDRFDCIFTNKVSWYHDSNWSERHREVRNMVGGLSECSMIQEAVYKAFPDNQIIIPMDAALSVLKGAVLFGH